MVRPNGTPIILTSEPHAWAYDPKSQSWTSLISPWDMSTVPLATRQDERGFLVTLETKLASGTNKPIGSENAPWWDVVTEMSYLDRRIRGSEIVDDEVGYRGYVVKYASVLGREGFVSRAEDLVLSLLGPMFA